MRDTIKIIKTNHPGLLAINNNQKRIADKSHPIIACRLSENCHDIYIEFRGSSNTAINALTKNHALTAFGFLVFTSVALKYPDFKLINIYRSQ